MSHATVAMSPAMQSMIATMMPALAVGTAGFAVTIAALAAAKKLRCDFEQAKVEFESRYVADEMARLAESDRQSFKAVAAAGFGAAIDAGSEDTTVVFLRRSLSDLANRAQLAGLTEVRQKAIELSATADTATAGETLLTFFALSDQVDKAPSADPNRGTLEAIRMDIQSPILAGATCESLRTEFEGQLQKLEAVGDRNASVVRQGAENLRARVRREIADQAERERVAIQDQRCRREIVSEAYAMLRAILQGAGDPDECLRASTLLTSLGAAFGQGVPPTISELEALLAKTRSLFEKCEKRLEDAAAHAYVAESVRDVLLNMGYNVSEVPSEIATKNPGCMVAIDGDSGVVVSVAADGRMLTEMVAFTSNGVDPDAEAEKKVCDVVDQILSGLRMREIPMLEKSRKKLRPGHKLRMVKKAKPQELSAAAAPKARTVE